jgi:hypothetical protein
MHWIDPAQLPPISGTIERFIANARAELDGLVLKVDGAGAKLVHFPSHMTGEVEAALNSGDVIIVRGLKPREAEMIAAIALERSDGLQIVDRGPPKHAPPSKAFKSDRMSVTGKVRMTLFTAKGKARGALLEDGTVVRMALTQAEQLKRHLQPGSDIKVEGTGCDTAYGRVIEVHHMPMPAGQYSVERVPRRTPRVTAVLTPRGPERPRT